MSLFTKIGEEAKKSANKTNVDLKTAYIRLKENESVRVRVLGLFDYVEYPSQGDFNLGIWTQPCIDGDLGYASPLTIAANSGVEGFDKLYIKPRFIFALYDIDMKSLRFWDCSKGQAKKMISDIEEYADSLEEIAFNFKRTGTKTDTVYGLNPILKLDAKGKEGFESADEVKVELANFESVLIPRTVDQQIEALKTAGFPVDQFFGNAEPEMEKQPIDLEEDANPLENM